MVCFMISLNGSDGRDFSCLMPNEYSSFQHHLSFYCKPQKLKFFLVLENWFIDLKLEVFVPITYLFCILIKSDPEHFS